MREKEQATTVILIRHGETDYPDDRIYREGDGPLLNEAGTAQAGRIAQFVAQRPADALYVSSSKRTIETSVPIADVIRCKPDIQSCLRERNFGVWEGLYFHEVVKTFPDEYNKWKDDHVGYRPEKGESIYDLKNRIVECVNNIVKRHLGRRIVVVTHVGPIRVLVTSALDIPLENYRQIIIQPGSATRIDYGIKKINLQYLNYTPGMSDPE